MSNNDVILEVKNLQTYFNTDAGVVKAVDGVNFDLNKGEVLGIVGESGSGKSVTSLSIMNLIPTPPGKIAGGEILFNGKNLLEMSDRDLRAVRGDKISMIFQDPMTSLNPFLRISTQLMETIELHQGLNRSDAKKKAIEMLQLVGIPDPSKKVDNYPHQFSGGMRQRVMIAMALSCNPEVLIADEPTTALDVTIQAQILDLIKDLSKRLNTAVIMITHDLGVVAGMCDKVCVMYAGKLVEKSSAMELFNDPKHPYTEGLIKSVPRLDKASHQKLYSIEGQPPNVIDLPECCPFHPRCDKVLDKCSSCYPPEIELGPDRLVRCWLYEEDK
ncbi:MAG: ABC transporter ATP-binding protein [Spirochaetaceae bacterium]